MLINVLNPALVPAVMIVQARAVEVVGIPVRIDALIVALAPVMVAAQAHVRDGAMVDYSFNDKIRKLS